MNADIIPAKTPAEIFLARAFDASKAGLPGNTDVAKWREASFKAFNASGLPHRRIEAWHYTDLRTLMRDALPLATRQGGRNNRCAAQGIHRCRHACPRVSFWSMASSCRNYPMVCQKD